MDKRADWLLENPIQKWRARLGMSCAEFAREVGVARSRVISWESGEYHPSWESLQAVAKVVNLKAPHVEWRMRVWKEKEPKEEQCQKST